MPESIRRTIKRLSEIGVILVITQFHKGFGFTAEREDMEYTKKLVEICHRYNIKVSGYIRIDNIVLETILDDEPGAKDWLRIDQDGKIPGYTYYRKHICFNNSGYEKYLKKVVHYGIKETGLDLMHFDGSYPGVIDHCCHCKICREKFHDYLMGKYGHNPSLAKERFGFSNISRLSPPAMIPHRPVGSNSFQVIKDSVFQEWIDFRCKSFADFIKRMSEYVNSLNSEVGIELNSQMSIYRNGAFYGGWLNTLIAPYSDVLWTEQGTEAGLTKENVLISKIREFKIARTLDNVIFCYQYRCVSPNQTKLSMCQAMAFNQQTLGELGGGDGGVFVDKLPFFKEKKECIDFWYKNKEHYLDTETVANVAILRSYPSMAYNCVEPYQSTLLFEQTLIQAKIPFDIIYDQHLEDLSKYSVIILANMESLTDGQMTLIRDFVKNGGGLVATEGTSAYNEWRRERKDFGLADVFGIHRKQGVSQDLSYFFDDFGKAVEGPGSEDASKEVVRNEFGKGRCVYIPEIKPTIKVSKDRLALEVPPESLALPENYQELVKAVNWASRDNLPIKVKAPLTVVIELLHQRSKNRIILHLLNYNFNQIVKDIEVDLEIPEGKSVGKIILLALDNKEPKDIDYTIKDKRAHFGIGKLEIYAMVIIETKKGIK